jgi:CheY-like chemotaxis protein
VHALIIEDEFMIATVIEFVLRDCGFDSFDIARSTEMAIAAAETRRPDLITADVQLETGSGLDAVAAICERPSIPVIFITASAAQVREQESRYAVLNKPFSEQTLTYAVAASLAVGATGGD